VVVRVLVPVEQLPLFQAKSAAGDAGGLGVVSHHQKRGAQLRVQTLHQFKDLLRALGVEVTRGLVGYHENGIGDNRPRNTDPLLLAPGKLPGLWTDEEITAKSVADYFSGSNVVQVERDGYQETMQIPKASQAVVDKAVSAAVEGGILWLLSGPASILGEPIPAGVLTPNATLRQPPSVVAPAEILPENLPAAWKEGTATAASIAAQLSSRFGTNLPWRAVKYVIDEALRANFLCVAEDSAPWAGDPGTAQYAKFQASKSVRPAPPPTQTVVLVAASELDPSQMQDLADLVPKLLEVKAKANVPLRFHVRIEMGDGKTLPSAEAAKEVNKLLKGVKDDLEVK